jgi:short-subunit dehydrogenase
MSLHQNAFPRSAIVTGASAGIGEAVARSLASAGFSVVAAARRESRLDALEAHLRGQGFACFAQPTDITVAEDRLRLVETAMNRFGRIDLLVNNAGIGYRSPIETTPIDAVRHTFEVNLFSLLALTQLVIPVMRKQGEGKIINMSSVAGRVARPLSSIYDATKHSIEAVSDGLRGELRQFGIHVVVVQPSFTETEFLDIATKASFPYYGTEPGYRSLLEYLCKGEASARRGAAMPQDIARTVLRAALDPAPARRYPCPRRAKVILALKRLLPEAWFERLAFPRAR